MITYTTHFRVEAQHIDLLGHCNWRAQLAIVEEIHFAFRNKIGIGLETLQKDFALALMMREITNTTYYEQLFLGDTIDVVMHMSISRRISLEFECLFRKGDKIVTKIEWLMPLVSLTSNRPCRIPQWISEIIGVETSVELVPASVT